jgi:hypothetical protein
MVAEHYNGLKLDSVLTLLISTILDIEFVRYLMITVVVIVPACWKLVSQKWVALMFQYSLTVQPGRRLGRHTLRCR